MAVTSRCPRCGNESMKDWAELTDDEREVVKRLPDSAGYTLDERRLRHEWCTRCWHEQAIEARDA